jgi:hypothetical protein
MPSVIFLRVAPSDIHAKSPLGGGGMVGSGLSSERGRFGVPWSVVPLDRDARSGVPEASETGVAVLGE